MAIFPVTYVAILIWLILATYENINVELKLSIRFMGFIFGFVTAILSMGGEKWVSTDSAGAFSVVTFNSGFGLPLGMTILGSCIVMLYITVLAWIDRKKVV